MSPDTDAMVKDWAFSFRMYRSPDEELRSTRDASTELM
jgi:hypothetical protein